MRTRASGFSNAPHAERGEDRPHILVVDGNLALRMDLRAALHGAGFHVTACESRVSARQALRARGFALAIVDAHLPDGSGLELVKEIRSAQAGMRTIMLSADADPRQRAHAVAAGAEDLFGKPLDMVPLLRRAVKLAGSAPKTTRAPESTRTPLRSRRILVVDADPAFRKALADSLRGDGEDVLMAGSAEEALALLSVDRVDALLVDYRLPEVSGLELCRRIRKDSLQRQVPIMVVARPSDDVDAYRKAMGAGADDLVVRSKEPAMVKVRLRGLLARMERERERERRGGVEPRSSLEEMSATLTAPARRPSSPPKARQKSIPPAPTSYRPPASGTHRMPSGLRPPPPPSFFAEVPSPSPSQPGIPQRRDEPDSGRLSGWTLARETREARDDRPSGIVPVGPATSRDGRGQPSSRRGTSAGSK